MKDLEQEANLLSSYIILYLARGFHMSSLVQSVKSLLEMLQLNCGVEQIQDSLNSSGLNLTCCLLPPPERYLCLFASFYLTLSNPFVVLVTLLTLERSAGETRHFRRLLGGGAT